MFITLEGTDGSGKSTQARRLADALNSGGVDTVLTFEPGGSPDLGPIIRKVFKEHPDRSARTEALLISADRSHHVDHVIEPALAAGKVVVCDRYVDSTIGYQGHGRGLDIADLYALCDFATGGVVPDLVIVIDVPDEVAAARTRDRGALDVLERDNVGARMRAFLLEQRELFPDRYVVIDGSPDPDAVADVVLDVVLARLAAARTV